MQRAQGCCICCIMPGPRGRIMTCTPLPWHSCIQKDTCQEALYIHRVQGHVAHAVSVGFQKGRAISVLGEKSDIDWHTSQVYCRPDFVPLPWQVSHFTLRAKDSFLQQHRAVVRHCLAGDSVSPCARAPSVGGAVRRPALSRPVQHWWDSNRVPTWH